MNQSIKKFLEFNGTNVYFVSAEGAYWVAIKPICEALNVHYEHQRETIKKDAFLGQLPRRHRVVAADGRLREMLCLPEKFVYGWLMQINSDSPDFLEFKWKCYDVLYNHFHGAITDRLSILKEKTLTQIEIEKLEEKIDLLPEVKRLNELKAKAKQESKKLLRHDQEFVSSQLPLWETETETSIK